MPHSSLALIDLATVIAIAGMLLGLIRLVTGRLDKRFEEGDRIRAQSRELTDLRLQELAGRIEAGISEHLEIRAANAGEHAEIRRSIEEVRRDVGNHVKREDWVMAWGILDARLEDIAARLTSQGDRRRTQTESPRIDP